MKDYHEYEKSFETKKNQRSERKYLQQKDRSKFKKTDQDKYLLLSPPENSKRARVVQISTGIIKVLLDKEFVQTSLKGSLKKEITFNKNLVTVGDFVWIDDRGQICFIEKRYSLLSRADTLHHRKQHLIASNIDQVLICSSVENPSLKPSLIDRYIIAASRGGMKPVIVINKIDLAKDFAFLEELEKIYTSMGIPFLKVSALKEIGIQELKDIIKGKASVLSGQSGVGKTSLVNDLTGSNRRVGEVVQKTKKGAHTTTEASLIQIDGGGLIIDTPGIKSFALFDISAEELSHYFDDLSRVAENCKFQPCSHTHEPDCAVKKALEKNELSLIRYNSYLAILEGSDKPNSLR
jgi:ribosome biogenesis GTPase